MSRIHQLIESLRQRSDVSVLDEEQAWLVVVSKGRDLFCEVTIPREVLEWYASVKRRQDKREVWSDWMDYSGYHDSPKEKLEAEMADHILAFIDRVSSSKLVLPLSIYEAKT